MEVLAWNPLGFMRVRLGLAQIVAIHEERATSAYRHIFTEAFPRTGPAPGGASIRVTAPVAS